MNDRCMVTRMTFRSPEKLRNCGFYNADIFYRSCNLFTKPHNVHQFPFMAACEEVLNIKELLEDIVLLLPLRSILLSQRVNRSFRRCITTSPKIQRALFCQPSTSERLEWHPDQDGDPYAVRCGSWATHAEGEAKRPLLSPFFEQ